jgi:hypothetical protein
MEALEGFDWTVLERKETRVELLEKVIGSYVPMPDGSQHYIEMPMIAWYWMHRLIARGRDMKTYAQTALDAMYETEPAFDEEQFNECYEIIIMSSGKGLLQGLTETGRHWTE